MTPKAFVYKCVVLIQFGPFVHPFCSPVAHPFFSSLSPSLNVCVLIGMTFGFVSAFVCHKDGPPELGQMESLENFTFVVVIVVVLVVAVVVAVIAIVAAVEMKVE